MSDRAGFKWVKVVRFLKLMANPDLGRTHLSVSRFEEVPIEQLKAEGIAGALVDADGTLGPHHTPRYPESTIAHLMRLRDAGIRVAIYTNDREDRFDQFEGIPVVSGVPAKPSAAGFLEAMDRFLGLKDPASVCMIGDNYITDGGAVEAGMKFVHVKPLPGKENPVHRLTRSLAEWRAGAAK